jgi:hypothetical protein
LNPAGLPSWSRRRVNLHHPQNNGISDNFEEEAIEAWAVELCRAVEF